MRLQQITHTTKELVTYLKQHPLVEEVIFPFDEDFSQYELARQQMKDACGLLTFVLKVDRVMQIEKFCESLQHILMAVSWGGHESLIIPRCSGIKRENFNADNREHRMLRLYVGQENTAYLIKDLERGFDSMA